MENTIPLSQKLYLLGIHPEKGGLTYRSYTAMDYIIMGSLLMELYRDKKIRFEAKRIVVLTTKADTELHRFILEKMNKYRSPRKISYWINKFNSSMRYIRGEVQSGLIEKRLIRVLSKRFLFFRWRKPELVNKQALIRLKTEIERQIFYGTTNEDELIFLSFLEPGGFLFRMFPDKHKRKQAKLKLKEMMVENRVSSAVADAISAAQAVAASVAVSAAVSSSAS
ncbi:GPP34 family phosphoprotein [Prolixibacteraceae bacterium Z1-6]|uniref:GPP34 family phosphoprotein n=1 Tax=Draconibacterium aestuarii TaxID=2998507 RepID=A0A9X3F3Y8_9BACT|nr:GPP34 family phosphoprotein [Prolixibacteraceae bacterium Z1-6]